MTYQRNISKRELSMGELEDGFDERLPDGVQQPEVATGEHDESESDGRALAHLAAIRPLHAAQLVDAVAEEGQQPAAALARTPRGPLALAARAARGDQVALDLVVATVGGLVVGELVGVDALLDLALLELGHAGLGHVRLLDVG